MKKLISLVLVLVCVLTFAGCKNDIAKSESKGDTVKSYCYVTYVTTDGFAANINDIGCVFIEYADAKDQIELFDTVVVEYHADDLIKENGSYIGVAGNEEVWSYRIKDPQNVRVADASKGEPVFG